MIIQGLQNNGVRKKKVNMGLSQAQIDLLPQFNYMISEEAANKE